MSQIILMFMNLCAPGQCSRYSDLLWAGQSENQILVGGVIFCACPDQPWRPPCLLCSGYQVSLPAVKQPGHGIDHKPPSNAKVKEGVELYLCAPWTFVACSRMSFTFTFTFFVYHILFSQKRLGVKVQTVYQMVCFKKLNLWQSHLKCIELIKM